MARRIFRHLTVFFAWNLVAGGFLLLLPQPAGLLVALALAAWLLQSYVLQPRKPGARRREANLRLRPLAGEPLRWTLIAIPVLFALSWSLGEVYLGLVPVPPETLNPFGPLIGKPLGGLAVTVFAVAVAPVLEEMFFRGLVQHPLERRWGPARAITLSAALFAIFHFLPWIFPLHLLLGIAFGWAVYATRSIWAGVILHAANNAAAVFGIDGTAPHEASLTVWDTGPTAPWWTALGVLVVAVLAAVWVGRGMWRAGRT